MDGPVWATGVEQLEALFMNDEHLSMGTTSFANRNALEVNDEYGARQHHPGLYPPRGTQRSTAEYAKALEHFMADVEAILRGASSAWSLLELKRYCLAHPNISRQLARQPGPRMSDVLGSIETGRNAANTRADLVGRLELDRLHAFFDVESTGKYPDRDRIVEITMIKLWPDGHDASFSTLVNPTTLIPAEASAIHGITDDMVRDQPTFAVLVAVGAHDVRLRQVKAGGGSRDGLQPQVGHAGHSYHHRDRHDTEAHRRGVQRPAHDVEDREAH
jgi:hypothetical protein